MAREINQVIDQLSKIEASSKEIISGTEAEKKAYAALMEQKTKDFDNALNEETEARLKQLKDSLEAQAQMDLQTLRTETDAQLVRLDEWYAANHTQLAQDILNQIVRL